MVAPVMHDSHPKPNLWVGKEMMKSTKVILFVLLSFTFQKFAQCSHKLFQFGVAEAVCFGAES
jgi:hypothetical protein